MGLVERLACDEPTGPLAHLAMNTRLSAGSIFCVPSGERDSLAEQHCSTITPVIWAIVATRGTAAASGSLIDKICRPLILHTRYEWPMIRRCGKLKTGLLLRLRLRRPTNQRVLSECKADPKGPDNYCEKCIDLRKSCKIDHLRCAFALTRNRGRRPRSVKGRHSNLTCIKANDDFGPRGDKIGIAAALSPC